MATDFANLPREAYELPMTVARELATLRVHPESIHRMYSDIAHHSACLAGPDLKPDMDLCRMLVACLNLHCRRGLNRYVIGIDNIVRLVGDQRIPDESEYPV